jgi:alkylated DNA repair dioxygenase AlkB
MTSPDQRNLFDNNLLPEGFRYEPEFLPFTEQVQLVRYLEKLPLRDFEFHGFLGKRRVVSYGWRYDFNDRELLKADDMPAFLLPLRRRAAAFAGLGPEDLQHVLVTEYAPGAAIGWHRDKAVFGEVVGISLLSPCRFRFRRRHAGTWQRAAFIAEPRSAYLLAGPARSDWEHSIPPMEQLRYSITFRNFVKASVTARLRA